MSLITGSASFVRFAVEGEFPADGLASIAERIKSFSFRDIDDNMDEYSLGWVSVMNMFDASFSHASFVYGDYVVLSMRIDERKVAPAILKKVLLKEEERVRQEKQLPKLSKSMKSEIKERVSAELTAKAIPIPSVYDLIWNLSEATVLFFTTNKKAHAILEDFFKDCFGLMIVHQIPYLTAEHLVSPSQLELLDAISPEVFV